MKKKVKKVRQKTRMTNFDRALREIERRMDAGIKPRYIRWRLDKK